MIVSIAEEMNPTRRNTMEDIHIVAGSGEWGAPSSKATFLGVADGHGGRLIADYVEDHLADNVAKEWKYAENEERQTQKKVEQSTNDRDEQHSKKRRIGIMENDNGNNNCDYEEKEDKIIQTALERAFLLTDIQSRMEGITTSGATVACCVVIPKFSPLGEITSISIHAANAGDARAVLSSRTATARSLRNMNCEVALPSTSNNNKSNKKILPKPELPNELPLHRGTSAVRITHDHKSTDPKEISRIESSGGIMIRGRVLGVLAVARSLGDHGLKEYVIGKPYLSSTVVTIIDADNDDDSFASGLNDEADRGGKQQQKQQEEITSQSQPPLQSNAGGPYTNGEFLIIACDGLWDVIEDQEAVDLVREYINKNGLDSREKVASFLIDTALRCGSTDNVTVIVYWL